MEAYVADSPYLVERVGAGRRASRSGPEAELVDWFLAEQPIARDRMDASRQFFVNRD